MYAPIDVVASQKRDALTSTRTYTVCFQRLEPLRGRGGWVRSYCAARERMRSVAEPVAPKAWVTAPTVTPAVLVDAAVASTQRLSVGSPPRAMIRWRSFLFCG